MPRRLSWSIALALSSLLAQGSASCARAAHAAPIVQRTGCIGLTVADLERSSRFYIDVLGFSPGAVREQPGETLDQLQGLRGARARSARVRLGEECLELTRYASPPGRPAPRDARSNDRWFQHVAVIVSDMDAAFARLQARGVERVSAAPQRLPDWNAAAAGIRAFYFRDPDRHVLEVLQFPPGKGDPRWHATHALFLGIDHTAIVVADTDESVRFYRDVLGLRVAGTSENYGPEQEALNDVPSAHLRITTLRADSGPGLELLEYLAPADGRPIPADERATDLVRWQTTLFVPDLSRALAALQAARARLISGGVVASALVARDPDGHVLQLEAE